MRKTGPSFMHWRCVPRTGPRWLLPVNSMGMEYDTSSRFGGLSRFGQHFNTAEYNEKSVFNGYPGIIPLVLCDAS